MPSNHLYSVCSSLSLGGNSHNIINNESASLPPQGPGEKKKGILTVWLYEPLPYIIEAVQLCFSPKEEYLVLSSSYHFIKGPMEGLERWRIIMQMQKFLKLKESSMITPPDVLLFSMYPQRWPPTAWCGWGEGHYRERTMLNGRHKVSAT